jgi:membrane protease YdiL (CAAX protease family)
VAEPRPSAALTPSPGFAPPDPPRVLVWTWAKAVLWLAAAAAVAQGVPWLRANLAGVAAFAFIALPDGRLRVRHEGWDRYGLPWDGLADARTWRAWGRGLRDGLLVCAVIFPLFAAAFWGYSAILPHLPRGLSATLAPYGGTPRLALRLPPELPLRILVQVLVVALPEELFYRGWMQTSWARRAPGAGVRILGARLGEGFLWTQLLFAVGHLPANLAPWRLATFFPGLLFGWVRERTGGVAAPIVVHALSNLFIATLEASFYG